jgi:hypothetical protein
MDWQQPNSAPSVSTFWMTRWPAVQGSPQYGMVTPAEELDDPAPGMVTPAEELDDPAPAE